MRLETLASSLAFLFCAGILSGCGVFDKENPPPNPLAEEQKKNIEDFTDQYCASASTTAAQKAMVARIRRTALMESEAPVPPYSVADCTSIAQKVLAASPFKLKQRGLENEGLDVGPLVVFTSLTSLSITDERLTDLQVLSPLVHLTDLRLFGAGITDLSPLNENHKDLKTLIVQNTSMTNQDVSLAKLGQLTDINLSYNAGLETLPKLPANVINVTAGNCALKGQIDFRSLLKLQKLLVPFNENLPAPLVPKTTTYLDVEASATTAGLFDLLWQIADDGELSSTGLVVNVGTGGVENTRTLLRVLRDRFRNTSSKVTFRSPQQQTSSKEDKE